MLTPMEVPPNDSRSLENTLESLCWPSVPIRAAGEFPGIAAGCLEGFVIFPLFWKVAASERIGFPWVKEHTLSAEIPGYLWMSLGVIAGDPGS